MSFFEIIIFVYSLCIFFLIILLLQLHWRKYIFKSFFHAIKCLNITQIRFILLFIFFFLQIDNCILAIKKYILKCKSYLYETLIFLWNAFLSFIAIVDMLSTKLSFLVLLERHENKFIFLLVLLFYVFAESGSFIDVRNLVSCDKVVYWF